MFTDYPEFSANYAAYGADVKYEDDDEQKYRPHEKLHENNGQGYHGQEEGEYDDRHY